jgi:5-methylcytosine-specific restriction endonuclease McrA
MSKSKLKIYMENSETKFQESIEECKNLHKESDKVYHIINDQFFTVVDEDYFNEDKPYHSLWNTDDDWLLCERFKTKKTP